MNAYSKGYLLGIGSNISPEYNIANIIDKLLNHFSQFAVSRVIKTSPVAMHSDYDFLNLVAFVETDSTEKTLKTLCNHIEIDLGRDRADPTSKISDRPADLDILTPIRFPDDNRSVESITNEYFLYPLLHELLAYLSGQTYPIKQTGIIITTHTLSFGQTATTVHRNTCARHKGIV